MKAFPAEVQQTWNPTKHPGVAAVALKVEQIHRGAEQWV